MKNKKKLYYILCVISILIIFIYRNKNILNQSFWWDETEYTIRYLTDFSFLDMIKELAKDCFNLPLYYIFLYPYYQIVPYGELWLLLPNLFIIILTIFIIKKIGDKIGGENFGYIISLLAVLSPFLISQGVLELRPYIFLIVFSTLAFYRLLFLLEERNKNNIIWFTISIILTSYSHWFGCLVVSFYFLYELTLFFKKKNSISFFIPYIILGICFLPWLILIYKTCNFEIVRLLYGWTITPTFKIVMDTFIILLNKNIIFYILFLVSIIYPIICLIKKKKVKDYIWFCIAEIVYVFSVVIILSTLVDKNFSLYVDRYFVVLLLPFFILLTYPIVTLINITKTKNIVINYGVKFCFIVFLIFSAFNNYKYIVKNPINHAFKEASDILIEEKLDKKSAYLSMETSHYMTYYFDKRGYDLPPNIYSYGPDFIGRIRKNGHPDQQYTSFDEILFYDKVYIFNVIEQELPGKLRYILETSFIPIKFYPEYYFYIYEKKEEKDITFDKNQYFLIN